MALPIVVYLYAAIAIVYLEAALQSLIERHHHRACRELVIAVLYGSIATWMVLDPVAMHLMPPNEA